MAFSITPCHSVDPSLGPLSEGAGTGGDWGSVPSSEVHSLRHGLRRATSAQGTPFGRLKEGGK